MYHRNMTQRLWITLTGLALAAVVSASVGAQSDANGNGCDGLVGVRSTLGHLHVWSETVELRGMEEACAESDIAPLYWQMRGTAENVLGNHRAALVAYDRVRPQWARAEHAEMAGDTRSIPALAYIAERAANHRFVMVNERHHVSTDRLLTLGLLRPLYEQGFRYLAAEALASWGEVGVRGYPIGKDGTQYIDDPVFGELLREAVALGYQIVHYELREEQDLPTDGMTEQQVRDYWQAHNLIAGTLKRDPSAKVLVHCGYSHLWEVVTPRWTPMAHYFQEATGLDPLTVDQILFAERGVREAEHPWRTDAESRGLVADQPVVLVNGEGAPLRVEPERVDIRVLNPRTEYVNGRPAWLAMDGRRHAVAISTPECVKEACVVEAFNAAWDDAAVPFDRVEVVAGTVDMYVPPGMEVELRAYRMDGSALFRRMTSTRRAVDDSMPRSQDEPEIADPG